MNKIEIIVDILTGEITQTSRPFTSEELANAQAIDLQKAEEIAQEQAQATAKASALAKLAALGLTQDEVKALVG
jgi:hypothetical protein